jgi:hypothetical protein
MIAKTSAMNYVAMMKAGLTSPTAFVIGALRARWVATGAYAIADNDRSVSYNEHTVVSIIDPTYGRIDAAMTLVGMVEAMGDYAAGFQAAMMSEKFGQKWVIKHSENIWAAVEHCFRVRAHHFKTSADDLASYTDLYTRFLKAAYEGKFEWPEEIKMVEVFHTAIHPFKIKALPVMVAHYVAHKKVANAAIIRMSGSPCGNAAITTAAAALDTMRAEAWWSIFYRAYKDLVDLTISVSKQVNDAKYAYHIGASLYGVEKKTTVHSETEEVAMDEAKSRVSAIAAACQGMITALKQATSENLISRFALSNARALEKPAASNPLLSIRITALVLAAINAVAGQEDLKKAIAGALPGQLEGDNASGGVKAITAG